VPEHARALILVSAGLVPESPEDQYSRQWTISSQDWDDRDQPARMELLADVNARASGYANLLMLQPDHVNWVRLDWVWL
jgi:hypothetical protein